MDFDDNLSQLNRLAETLMNSFESELTAEQKAELEDIMFYKDFNNISEIQTELQKISGYEKQIKSRQQEAKQKSEQERQEAEELIINDMSNIAFGSDQLGEMLDDLIKVKGVSTLAELRDVLDVYPEEIYPDLNLDGDTVYQGLINTAGEDLIKEMVRQGENTSVTQSVLQNAGYTGVTAEELIQAREARQQEERRQDQAMRERAEKAKAEGEKAKQDRENKKKTKDKDMAAPADAQIPVDDMDCSAITMVEMKMLKLQELAEKADKQGLVDFFGCSRCRYAGGGVHQLQLQSPQARGSCGQVPREV
jgi:hypothetical protein